jgi:hypothetical protein
VKLVVLCLIFALFTALVPSNYVIAVSNSVVISKIQTGGSGSGTTLQEYVQIFNNSENEVNITNWCLQFSSDTNILTADYREIICLEKLELSIDYVLKPNSYALFVSSVFSSENLLIYNDGIFSNNTNIPGTNGSVRLINDNNIVIDMVGWGNGISETTALSSLSGGNIFLRKIDGVSLIDSDNNSLDFDTIVSPSLLEGGGISEILVQVDVCENIPDLQIEIPYGYLVDEDGFCKLDVCPNLDELQVIIPEGYQKLSSSINCTLVPLESAVLLITELYPNAPSTDAGNEFIEIYNPNNRTIDLKGYKIQVGPSFTKEYVFDSGGIGSGQYKTIKDTQSGIVLPNTSGVKLRLVSPAGGVVSETAVYSNASDGVSWALVDDQWIYTNQVTPETTNQPYVQPIELEIVGVTSVLAPCPVGKYRNPETNRCRNIETAVSQLVPCDEDEYRSPDTNRCRKIALASALSACPEGQERNPETNRCRKVSVLGVSSTDVPTITDIQSINTASGINWNIISITLIATIGYLIYEWRFELRQYYSRLRQKLVQ